MTYIFSIFAGFPSCTMQALPSISSTTSYAKERRVSRGTHGFQKATVTSVGSDFPGSGPSHHTNSEVFTVSQGCLTCVYSWPECWSRCICVARGHRCSCWGESKRWETGVGLGSKWEECFLLDWRQEKVSVSPPQPGRGGWHHLLQNISRILGFRGSCEDKREEGEVKCLRK